MNVKKVEEPIGREMVGVEEGLKLERKLSMGCTDTGLYQILVPLDDRSQGLQDPVRVLPVEAHFEAMCIQRP
jgi:hypothetical protein